MRRLFRRFLVVDANLGTFTTARTCEYHDHTALSVPAFQGRIIIK